MAYRRGGPLTVTDCNVLLGKLQPGFFPRLFGPDGDQPLDVDSVRAAFAALAEAVGATGRTMSAEQIAEGFIAIAVANMANAIKKISVARGHDVTRYTLACFGGAGGQHACLVADALGMARVMIHPLAGVLSACGIGLADRRVMRERTLGLELGEQHSAQLETAIARLAAEAEAALRAQGVAGPVAQEATVHLRYAGTDTTIAVRHAALPAMRAEFAGRHAERFGFVADAPLVAETIGCEAVLAGIGGDPPKWPLPPRSAGPAATVSCFLAGQTREVPLYQRDSLAAGFTVTGPVIVVDANATTVVEPGWRLAVDGIGNLILTRDGARAAASGGGTACDPVRLEIMGGLFMAIAEEMGAALQHSASSVNIRERLDFSCAIFDGSGNLVANAPHMPVHLGSMGESVRTVLHRRADGADGRGIRAGDVYALNAPYDGGTHLPDITVIMPVFAASGDPAPAWPAPTWFVAARGHHADIGGITPGSMPPASTHLDEEGVLIDNMLIVSSGKFREAEVAALLSSGRWPSRNVGQNLADLKAQVAACARGAAELHRIAGDYGALVVDAYMRHVQDHAEAAVRRLAGPARFRQPLLTPWTNGAQVVVRIAVDRAKGSATVDFTGTSEQSPDNFNAPLPVVRAAVLYVIRTLIDEPIPMNEGCLRPITIVALEGTLLNPRYPAAVVAGNVETSQVITDALFGALGAMAAAQGTMNNFTFGNDRHQYYETIAGGSGAGPDFDGAAVIQTHMTNSRLTDPEILETRFPVLVEEFAVRAGTGGAGTPSWRRWRLAAHSLPRTDDGGHPRQSAAGAALWPGRRRRRRGGRQSGDSRRW